MTVDADLLVAMAVAYSQRGPLGARFADPVSQQALALTAPFYRDF